MKLNLEKFVFGIKIKKPFKASLLRIKALKQILIKVILKMKSLRMANNMQ